MQTKFALLSENTDLRRSPSLATEYFSPRVLFLASSLKQAYRHRLEIVEYQTNRCRL